MLYFLYYSIKFLLFICAFIISSWSVCHCFVINSWIQLQKLRRKMWKLKIAEGNGPYLYSTNNFVGRQIWEYDPNGGTPEEREELEKAREEYTNNKKKGVRPCGDLFMRMQVINHLARPVSISRLLNIKFLTKLIICLYIYII